MKLYYHPVSTTSRPVVLFASESGIELDYQFQNTQRLGVALNHLSNAGIYSHNPGEENVILTYSIPVGHWW